MIDYDKPILNKRGKPLVLLEAAAHHCVRCIKKSRALQKAGYTVHGMGNRVSYGTDGYETYQVWQNEKQFKSEIKAYIDLGVDVITFDNEPDYPVKWLREVIGDREIPLVVDLHDLDSIRKNYITKEERHIFNVADGIIYVSQSIQEITNKLHKFDKPNIVLYSYCNEGVVDYDPNLIHERKGVVYEGGGNARDDERQNQVFPYRNLYPIIKKLVDQGWETTMYCGNVSAYNSYQYSGAKLFPPLPYDEMMEKMTKHKYGVLIFNNKDKKQDQVNYTLTNKFFEYVMCGLPSLACWCPESMKLVDKWGVGFTFEDIEEIIPGANFEDKYLEVMDNIEEARKQLVMEHYIWKLEDLYAELLGVEKKGIPENIRKLNEFEYGKEATNKLLT